MIKQYIQQAWAQLRQHPVIGGVTVVGTALSIFLIMVVVMQQQVQVLPFAPESNRDRFLHVHWMSLGHTDWGQDGSSNGPMSDRTARFCFKELTTPEAVTIFQVMCVATPLSMPGQAAIAADMRQTDDVFWRVFDFAFIDGKPYDQASFDAGLPVAVLTERMARKLFGTTACSGQEFLLNHAPYRVQGVVKDVSPLAKTAYAEVWIPYTSTDAVSDTWSDDIMGMFSATILARHRSDFPAIREECERRRQEYDKQIGELGYHLISRNRPYDQEKNALVKGANIEPDVEAARRSRFIVFLILLIVPAVNISSMTQSRLRQRISEIGLRRSFGCTRTEVLWQILAENLVVTLLAGVLGLILSVLFAYFGNDLIFTSGWGIRQAPTVSVSMLLHPSTFAWALFFCFVLNLLSSGLPAWRASRMGIVNALLGGRK